MDYTSYFSWALALGLAAMAGTGPSTVFTETLEPRPVIPAPGTASDPAQANSGRSAGDVERSVVVSQPIPMTPNDTIQIRLTAPNRGYFTLPYKVELLDANRIPLQLDRDSEWLLSNFSKTRTLQLPANMAETTFIYVRLSHLGIASASPIRLKVERTSVLADYLTAGIVGCLGIGGLAFLATTKSGQVVVQSFEQQVYQSPVTEVLGKKDTLIRILLRATLVGKAPYQLTLSLQVLDEQGQRLWNGNQVVKPRQHRGGQAVATAVWFLVLPERQNYRLFGQVQGNQTADGLLLSVMTDAQTNRPVDVITVEA